LSSTLSEAQAKWGDAQSMITPGGGSGVVEYGGDEEHTLSAPTRKHHVMALNVSDNDDDGEDDDVRLAIECDIKNDVDELVID
jgi:hypothetical protein